MKAFFANQFVLPLPAGHRFPMARYSLLREAVGRELPQVIFELAPQASDDELALAHTPDYIQAIADGTVAPDILREIGFPWSPAMVERARRSVGATVAAARVALKEGVAANLAGGTHHASAAVTARLMQAEHARFSRQPLQVTVVDLDVHQGNGTASIFSQDASVFTLSVHGAQNFPFRKVASDLDVALPDGCGDDDYLHALDLALEELGRRFAPSLIVYLAGADPLASDRLGRLNLSPDGLEARDLAAPCAAGVDHGRWLRRADRKHRS